MQPLPFDIDYVAKPAFSAMLATLQAALDARAKN
jgi:hypothetical protein